MKNIINPYKKFRNWLFTPNKETVSPWIDLILLVFILGASVTFYLVIRRAL